MAVLQVTEFAVLHITKVAVLRILQVAVYLFYSVAIIRVTQVGSFIVQCGSFTYHKVCQFYV